MRFSTPGFRKMLSVLEDTLAAKGARYLWVCLTVVSIFGMIDIPDAPNTFPKVFIWGLVILMCCLKGTLLTFLLAYRWKFRMIRWLFGVLVGIYVFFCIVNGACHMLYGLGITHRLVTIVMQTNMREVGEFMPWLSESVMSSRNILTVISVIVYMAEGCIVVGWLRRTAYDAIVGITSLLGLIALCLSVTVVFKSHAALLMCVRVPKNIIDTVRENREYQRLIAARRPLLYADRTSSSHAAETVVFIVGESAHRDHHSIYGYPLPTTPNLMNLRDSLSVFTDAIGSSQSTASNMERLLSLKIDDRTAGDWYKYPLLTDIFNAAGYKTFWLSNQECKGFMSDAAGAMVSGADVTEYTSSESSEDTYAGRYDDVLLPYIDKSLRDSAPFKFIGVHLLGSHNDYVLRYPHDQEVFTKEDILRLTPRPWLNDKKAATVAQYDNSIHFTDQLLGRIISSVSTCPRPALLVYVSDHGEEVYDTEDYRGRNEKCVKVPLIMYANNAYRERNPEIMDNLRKSVGRPVSTACIPMALLSMTGISYPLYDSSNDFVSPDYKIRPRLVDEKIWRYEHVK